MNYINNCKDYDLSNLTIKKLLPSKTLNQLTQNFQMNTTYIGIDFGTSTTVVSLAYYDTSCSQILSKSIELNQKLHNGAIYSSYKIPTMIGWYNKRLLIGEGANQLKLKLKQGKNLWHSFKMELGEDIGYKYPQSEINNKKIKLLNPKDVTTLFFKYLKTQIEKYVKTHKLLSNIEYAVSIPASFEANQRKDLIDSLNDNDMMVDKQALIDEPNSAFLSYVSDPELKSEISILEDYPTNILVFDFGAGTCDISIIEVGYSSKGFYSKNLSISRFEALGGNDIDKMIAKDILLPQFLKENKKEESFFKRKELEVINNKLEKSAELLKIKTSKEMNLLSHHENFSDLINRDETVSINHKIELKTRKGDFTLHKPSLSYHEFIEINDNFTDIDYEYSDCKSIFSPINSALKKSHLEKDDIDYILFIGGSAKNPLIQKSLKEYFNESEYLIPKDLQAHVSQGASIHSMIFNGFNKNIIEPITSEPILLITQEKSETYLKTLLKAGTTIPCGTIVIEDLKPQIEGQKIIELPLCIGSKEKILQNIKIESDKGFRLDSKIRLEIHITADKMLVVKGNIDGKDIDVEPLNPFTNKEMSLKEREKFKADKEYNKAVASNGGTATFESLKKLYQAYDSLGFYLEVAELLEELYEKHNYSTLNNVGVAYDRAGEEEKALKLFKKAMEDYPSTITAHNIALHYKYKDKKVYQEWLEKALELNPTDSSLLYKLGILLDGEEDTRGLPMIRKAFNSLKYEYEHGDVNIYTLKSYAQYLEEYAYVSFLDKEIEKNRNISTVDSDDLFNEEEEYNKKHLTTVKHKDELCHNG
jgi:molecular chaperone DnaK (HSP70)